MQFVALRGERKKKNNRFIEDPILSIGASVNIGRQVQGAPGVLLSVSWDNIQFTSYPKKDERYRWVDASKHF